ncbi:MAG: SpoIIE family protein phosphatase [Rhodobacteraceae bacterium]|nr:SpoIIE family protein phosphatase [Paracoccaceae bacterium]
MDRTAPEHTGTGANGGANGSTLVLVVDDSAAQRRLIATQVARLGYRVVTAGSGEEALDLCRTSPPDIVLSDWLMGGMSGIDFCRAFRQVGTGAYGYFILLTSKSAKEEIALGLESGADDFLVKPVDSAELRGRIAAGERIVRMQRDLSDRNRTISAALDQIRSLYDSINRDLIEARRLQQSLVRERFRSFGASDVSLVLRPSGHVGGDLVGFFPINARRVGIYALDVAGHGIASAMMTARLAGYLSGTSPDQNVALELSEFGIYDGQPPAEVARSLNRIAIDEMRAETFFTLAYADADLTTGRVSMVQAGHPRPSVVRADGRVEFFGEGGFPIGMFPEAPYTQFDVTLRPGDRLILASDGITEARGEAGQLLGEAGMARLLERNAHLSGQAFLEAVIADLEALNGEDFADDVSAALLQFHGAKTNAD